jgi:hypothetical protein
VFFLKTFSSFSLFPFYCVACDKKQRFKKKKELKTVRKGVQVKITDSVLACLDHGCMAYRLRDLKSHSLVIIPEEGRSVLGLPSISGCLI